MDWYVWMGPLAGHEQQNILMTMIASGPFLGNNEWR